MSKQAWVWLTPEQMQQADRLSIEAGRTGFDLMMAAGEQVVHHIQQRWQPQVIHILCGPGNNGGDGFVVARLLQQQGWPVRVALLGDLDALRGEAKEHAALWTGPIEPLVSAFLDDAQLVVDALFGTGLSRPLDASLQHIVTTLNAKRIPVCAVDIPSGINGLSGAVMGAAVQAMLTVSFARKKSGLLLFPGRAYCGELIVVDIGIEANVINQVAEENYENHPDLWAAAMPWPHPTHHKYSRGHVLVRGGRHLTGASRLSAMAAARIGAGLVSLAVPSAVWPVYAASMLSVMVGECDSTDEWAALLADERRNVLLLGPGGGLNADLKAEVLQALATRRSVVLDADALSAFADAPQALFDAINGVCVLTPHGGEFARLFGASTSYSSKVDRARAAANKSQAIIILKGADTVIAEPNGRVVINTNAPAELATGGTGDVLAGFVSGLIAQGMPAFEAACAAVWLHGRAASQVGPGLLAEDLPAQIGQVLAELKSGYEAI